MMTEPLPAYVLGHADQEIARLTRQAAFIDPSTRQFFQEAGIASGMRVLDVGRGAGHTAFVVAELVGPTGEVIGTDRAAEAVKRAQTHVETRGLRNVSFRQGDPAEMVFERPFDAVVGRYVLVFNHNQPQMLRRLAKHVRTGGVVLFQEPTMLVARSLPPVELYDRCCFWMQEGFRIGGCKMDTAYVMHETFCAAGFSPPTMRMHVPIGGAPNVFEWLHILVGMVRTLLPAIEEHNVAMAAEVDIDTLYERLCRDIADSGSTVLGRADIAAWSRV
jgi:SAM-dependent methyltransferase